MSKHVNMLAAVYPTRERADVILQMLQSMHRADTITLTDASLVTKDVQGKMVVEETHELTTRKGLKRGAIVAGAFGLIFPPSLIASAILGGAVGAAAGKVKDTGIKSSQMHELVDKLEGGKAAVVVLATDDSVVQVQRALEGYDGELLTHLVDEETMKQIYIAEGTGV